MTETSTALPSKRPAYGAMRVAVLQLVLLALAVAAVTLFSSPWPVQLISLAVLALIPGSALTHLLLAETRPRPLLADPAIRLPLAVVFGAVTLLALTFGLNIAGVPIKTTSVAVGAAVLACALVLGQAVRRSPRYGPGLASLGRPTAAAVTAAAAIATAVACAIALQPKTTETYSTLTFVDHSWLVDPSQPAVADSAVRVNWMLRTFGYTPNPSATSAELSLDGNPTAKIAVDIGTPALPTGPGQPTELGGAVTFAAPSSPGIYRLSISVHPSPVGGLGGREPVTLTGWLNVNAP